MNSHWTRLILSYARFKRLFLLRVEDAEVAGGEWDEILRNDRINREFANSVTPVCFISVSGLHLSRETATFPSGIHY